ncbi:MAG: hypothetical protein AAFY81_11125, partial [Pseudomonadota bacterium]
MKNAERAIALRHRFHDYAEAENIGHIPERNRLFFQFAPDGIGFFASSLDAAVYAMSIHRFADSQTHPSQIFLIILVENRELFPLNLRYCFFDGLGFTLHRKI